MLLALILALGCTAALTASAEDLYFPELPDNTLSITVSTANFGTDQTGTRMMQLWQEKMEEYLGVKLDITWQIIPWMTSVPTSP